MGQPNCKESGLVNDERIIQRLPFSMLVHYQRNCMCTNPEACFHHCTGEDKCRGAIELCRFCKGTEGKGRMGGRAKGHVAACNSMAYGTERDDRRKRGTVGKRG